jgi:hypothetical protein
MGPIRLDSPAIGKVQSSVPSTLAAPRLENHPNAFPNNPVRLSPTSNRHVMRGALRRPPPPLVVNLSGDNVPVTEQLLHFRDIDAGVEEQRRRGRPQRVRRVAWIETLMSTILASRDVWTGCSHSGIAPARVWPSRHRMCVPQTSARLAPPVPTGTRQPSAPARSVATRSRKSKCRCGPMRRAALPPARQPWAARAGRSRRTSCAPPACACRR